MKAHSLYLKHVLLTFIIFFIYSTFKNNTFKFSIAPYYFLFLTYKTINAICESLN